MVLQVILIVSLLSKELNYVDETMLNYYNLQMNQMES